MPVMLESTNTAIGGIGMSKSQWVLDAEERGYREALLDVYCFLTGNEQILDYPDRFLLIEAMVAQVNDKGGKLLDVTDSSE